VLDTSAILSGKPINLENMVTVPGVKTELAAQGNDYQIFQFQRERGLSLYSPSQGSLDKIKQVTFETGDSQRLSDVDKELLALALDINKNKEEQAVILTDDYSIQNVAQTLGIKFENVSQTGITKRFKWIYRCRGCGRKFKEHIHICPVCGASTKTIVYDKKDVDKEKM
jgi:UPF0271 protein